MILFTLSPEQEAQRKPLAGTATPGLFRELVQHVARQARRVRGLDLLVCAPSRRVCGLEVALPQRGRDFGESLGLAVEDAFARGYRRVLVVGNDAPGLDAGYLQAALRRLGGRNASAVLGPAEDGGYVLLGIDRPCAAAFRDMPWGTAQVAERTRRRLIRHGFHVSHLDPLVDVDGSPSLARWLIDAHGPLAARLRALLRPIRRRPHAARRSSILAAVTSVASRRGPPHLARPA